MTDDRHRIKVMSRTWVETYPDAVHHRREYKATWTDRHYRATEPLQPKRCLCESPGLTDDGECWKCGRDLRQPEEGR